MSTDVFENPLSGDQYHPLSESSAIYLVQTDAIGQETEYPVLVGLPGLPDQHEKPQAHLYLTTLAEGLCLSYGWTSMHHLQFVGWKLPYTEMTLDWLRFVVDIREFGMFPDEYTSQLLSHPSILHRDAMAERLVRCAIPELLATRIQGWLDILQAVDEQTLDISKVSGDPVNPRGITLHVDWERPPSSSLWVSKPMTQSLKIWPPKPPQD